MLKTPIKVESREIQGNQRGGGYIIQEINGFHGFRQLSAGFQMAFTRLARLSQILGVLDTHSMKLLQSPMTWATSASPPPHTAATAFKNVGGFRHPCGAPAAVTAFAFF